MIPRRNRIFWVMVIPALVAACGRGEPRDTQGIRFDTLEDGTVLIENDGSGKWDSSTAWVALEDLRIGTVDAGGPSQFAVISGIAVDSAGKIFVAEAQASEVRVFFPDGEYSQTLGRDGEGPGEFRVPYGVHLDPGGNLWVRDARTMRYSKFSPDGTFLRSYPIRVRSAIPNWAGAVDSEGRLTDWSVLLPYIIERDGSVRSNPLARSPSEIEYIPIRHDSEGQIQDSLPSVWETIDYVDGTRIPRPYRGTLLLHVGPGLQVWMANTREYRITRRDLEAEHPDLAFQLPFDAERVTSQERMEASQLGNSGRRISEDQVLDTKPILYGIIADGDGHVLVFPQGVGIQSGEVADVFLDTGIFLGRVRLPVRLEMRPEPIMKRGSLYGVTKDNLDVPFVIRLQMGPRAVGGL